MSSAEDILAELRNHANPANVAGMARFGISAEGTLGVSMPTIRSIAREHRRQHELALQLWASGVHEARILAALVDDPKQVTEDQLGSWVADLESWDVCDQLCNGLIRKTPFAWPLAFEWARDDREFVKRAGFVVVCTLAVHDKAASDERFEAFFPEILASCNDERNFVRKAVNWSIRQIGKRNLSLNEKTRDLCEEVLSRDTRAARWIARDALRELSAPKTMERLQRKASRT